MRRTDRLFEIVQLFRGGQLLLARDIANTLEVSVRTVYRDIDTLITSGIPIEGERGVGYILRAPIFLPPLNISNDELEALHMGMKVIQNTADDKMGQAAKRLLDKVDAVLPNDRQGRSHLDHLSVYTSDLKPILPYLAHVKRAVEKRHVIDLAYSSLSGLISHRRIRPLQVEYWGTAWTCAAWCELRNDFRAFRIDLIQGWQPTGQQFSGEEGKMYSDYIARYA